MSNESRIQALHRKLVKIKGTQSLESVAGGSQLESVDGSGLDALYGGTETTFKKLDQEDYRALGEDDVMQLEAIVEAEGRQVSYILNGRFIDLPYPWGHFNTGDIRMNIERATPAIGRLELFSASGLSTKHVGTGFVVGDRLLMTNRHVAEVYVSGVGNVRDQLVFKPGLDNGAWDAGREKGFDPGDLSRTLRITGVRMVHPYWDMALFEIDALLGIAPLTLSLLAPEDLEGREIATVGYPGRGNDRSAMARDLEARHFENVFGVKRIAPGEIRGREATVSFKKPVPAMTHDCSTLAGNSGSAILDIRNGHVLGLHFKGVTLKANYSVPLYELARDRRVVDLGLKFGGIVPATDDWEKWWKNPAAEEALIAKPRTPGVRTPVSPLPPRGSGLAGVITAAPVVSAPDTTVSVTVPITITISAAEAHASTAPAVGDAPSGAHNP